MITSSRQVDECTSLQLGGAGPGVTRLDTIAGTVLEVPPAARKKARMGGGAPAAPATAKAERATAAAQRAAAAAQRAAAAAGAVPRPLIQPNVCIVRGIRRRSAKKRLRLSTHSAQRWLCLWYTLVGVSL